MKSIFLSITLVVVNVTVSFSQYFNMGELITLCTSKSWVETNELLSEDRWAFNASSEDSKYNVVEWSWGRNGDLATSWLTISFPRSKYSLAPPVVFGNKVFYVHSDEAEYNSLINELKLNEAEVTHSEVLDDKLVVVYSWRAFDFKFTVSKDTYEILAYQMNRNVEPSLFHNE